MCRMKNVSAPRLPRALSLASERDANWPFLPSAATGEVNELEKIVDALLAAGAPPPMNGRADDASWDERADAIVQHAKQAPKASSVETAKLFEAPELLAEPGEPQSGLPTSVGVSAMSESDRPKPSQRAARPSLKELAERVSKTPPPPSVSAVATPLPASRASSSAVATPLPSSPPSASASQGVASLSARAAAISAAPPSIRVSDAPASISAPPSSIGPSSVPPAAKSDAPPASVVPASNVVPIAAAKTTVQADTGGSGAKLGIGIAALGIAAAAALFFFLQSTKTPERRTAAKSTAAAVETERQQPASTDRRAANEAGRRQCRQHLADASAKRRRPRGRWPAPVPGTALAANYPKAPPKVDRVDPDGTLEDEMKKHAGDPTKNGAEPAAEDVRPKNVPDRPATGVVTSAVGAVKGGARSCVAGADDVSTATITFGSSGAVQSVSVSGWAAGKPAAACIQSALKGANVGPFAQPSFSFSVSIRP
jgi:hypothetical protein